MPRAAAMLPAMAFRRCLVLLLAACGAPPAPRDRLAAPTDLRLVHELPAGQVVRLLDPRSNTAAVSAGLPVWWREAMRQSVRFDVAAGADDLEPGGAVPVRTLDLFHDPGSQVLTASLLVDDAAPLPLCSVHHLDRPLHAAVDELALRTRAALGETDLAAAVPAAVCTSADEQALRLYAQGLDHQARAELGDAARLYAEARRRDGASPLILDALAAVRSVAGEAEEARALAEGALVLRERASPPLLHRLSRTMLLCRAGLDPARASAYDRDLAVLAAVARRERPHDPQCVLTAALAHNFADEFVPARELLEPLRLRLPANPTVLYHLGYARLGCGEPGPAADAFALAAPHLPRGATLLPHAIALCDAGRHDELRRLLAELASLPGMQHSASAHDIRRMRAAHAILCNDRDGAIELLLADLAWLREHPDVLDQRIADYMNAGIVLFVLGESTRLGAEVDAWRQLRADGARADALTFLDGLRMVRATGERALQNEATLQQREGYGIHAALLIAFGHRMRGEVLEEHQALLDAARLADGELVKALLARSLDGIGRTKDAANLREALRGELHQLHLRQRSRHPLLSPERALAVTL